MIQTLLFFHFNAHSNSVVWSSIMTSPTPDQSPFVDKEITEAERPPTTSSKELFWVNFSHYILKKQMICIIIILYLLIFTWSNYFQTLLNSVCMMLGLGKGWDLLSRSKWRFHFVFPHSMVWPIGFICMWYRIRNL